METILILLLLTVIAIAAATILFLIKERRPKNAPEENQALVLLQNQINEMGRTLDVRLGESSKAIFESSRDIQTKIQSQFGESAKIIKEITQELTKVGEGQKQVMNVTEQLKGLEDILKNPKQRGILGEYYLETLLKNVFPPNQYQMQYKFKDGTIVDAVVFVKDKIIPIDSKFSLENYNRLAEERDPVERERLEKAFKADLKNRIDETAKYVKPEEGTLDFAFMFIPHEAIYYDLLVAQVGAVKINTRDLIEYAFKEKHVIIVSPTSFLAYLQTVLQGLKALQIEESAKEIKKRVEDLGKHLSSYGEYIKKLGVHLGTTVSMYDQASREFGKIDKDVIKIGGEGLGVKLEAIKKPSDGND